MDIPQTADKLSNLLMIPALRSPLMVVSSIVKEHTGAWFHPCTWQMFGCLVLTVTFYWFYACVKSQRAS